MVNATTMLVLLELKRSDTDNGNGVVLSMIAAPGTGMRRFRFRGLCCG